MYLHFSQIYKSRKPLGARGRLGPLVFQMQNAVKEFSPVIDSVKRNLIGLPYFVK